MTEYELALQEYMQRLKGGFGNAMKTVGRGASMPLSTSMVGKGIEGITGLLSGEEVGTGALGSDAESGFLKSLLGGNLEVNDANTQKVFDSLDHLKGAGVTRNNASGTDPTMMVNPDTAVRNLGIGVDGNTETYGFTGDTLTPEAMNQFRAREGITALTAEEQNYVNFLQQTQPEMVEVFLQGLRDGNYEMEMQPRLTQGFR